VELACRPCGGIVRILRSLSELSGGRRWPLEGGPASLEAMGGGVHDGIGLCPLMTVPARGGGTVELARRPYGGIVRILRRLSEPSRGRRWPPEGGPASLEAMGGGVHDGIGALPNGIGLCPLATVPARAGNGGTGSRPCGGIGNAPYSVGKCPIPSCTPPPMASGEAGPPYGGHRRPPGGSESLRKIGTMPPHGRPRNGGTGSPPVRGHRLNFTKAL